MINLPAKIIAIISVFVSTISSESVLQSHFILSGKSGSGKTTVVKKVGEILKNNGIPYCGFYVREYVIGNSRCGFDVIDFNTNVSIPLARISYTTNIKGPRVGRFVVNVESFESMVKQMFSNFETLPSILLLDEVGKMELESMFFQGILTDLFNMGSQYIILISVPHKRDDLVTLVNICKLPTSKLIEMLPENKDVLPEMLAQEIIQLHKILTTSPSDQAITT